MNVSQSMVNDWEENNFFLKVDGVRAWLGDYYFGSVFEFETIGDYVFEHIGTYDPVFESWDYLELSDGGRIATISDTSIDLRDLQWSLKEVEGSGGDPEPDPLPTIDVDQDLIDDWAEEHFHLEVDGVSVVVEGEYSGEEFTFVAEGDYVFTSVGFYDFIFGTIDELDLSPDGKVAYLPAEMVESISWGDFRYELELVEGGGDPEPDPDPDPDPELPTITVAQYLIDDWAEDNFHLEVDGVPVVTGGDHSGEEFTFVADGNYVFETIGFYDVITETTTNLVLSPNRKIAYLPAEMVEDIYWRNFNYKLEFSEEVESDVRGANSVFRVSDEALKEITHKRFDFPVGGDEVDDFGKFILGLIELPFEVGEEFVLGTEPVRLGRLNTGVMGEVLSVDRMSFDLGSISVGEEFGDFRDYQDVVGVLHLPYAESVVLETEYVVGQEISVELVVSLYDGTADYVIRSSFADGVALTQKVSLEVDVPFANVDGVPQRNSPSNMTFGVHNGVYTAYVELKRRESLLVDGMFTIPVVDEALLGDQSGFVRVDEVELSVECTAQEMDMLESVLKEGVFIR